MSAGRLLDVHRTSVGRPLDVRQTSAGRVSAISLLNFSEIQQFNSESRHYETYKKMYWDLGSSISEAFTGADEDWAYNPCSESGAAFASTMNK